MVHKSEFEIVATFVLILKVHMNILFMVKVKIPMLNKWSYRPPTFNQVDYWT